MNSQGKLKNVGIPTDDIITQLMPYHPEFDAAIGTPNL